MRLNGVEELLCGPALRNSVWQELVRTQRLNSRDSVLLLGESGTGKSFVARFIHENSRKNGDFITLNSAKVKRIDLRKGVDAANAGTLFLDEVHNLHTMRQEELLADVSGPGKKDIRLISASSKPLQRQHSQFMPDFWARVSECVFVLPPLRLHKRDLGEAIKKYCHDNSYIIEDEVLDAMVGGPFTWNNNWRDVEKVLKYLIEKLRMISIHAIDKNAVRRVYDEIHADAKKAMLRVVRS
jgi:DNA-binding NtrC family response regulator